MFCKNCGQLIGDQSKFCSFCGTLQQQPATSSNPEHFVNHRTIQKLESIFGINISKQIVGYYLIWFSIHLILLLVNWDVSEYANERFWPFSVRSRIEHYDLSEFLLYSLLPLIILVIINLFKETENH